MPPRERLRVGLVGGGFMAKTHSLAYGAVAMLDHDELPVIERRRLVDIDARVARTTAERFGWGAVDTDWTAVTRASDIDLVDIAVPNDCHAEIAIDAAAHGKHVLCEKPLADSLVPARRMEAAVARAGVTGHVGFVFRKWPAVALAKQLLEEGRIGRPMSFRAHYFHDYALDPDAALGWRADSARAGAGSIGDLGSHVIDLARHLVGEVSRVSARTHAFRSAEVDDAADCLLEFEGGAIGTLSTSWMQAGSKTDIGFELAGDRGALRFTWRRNGELQVYEHAGDAATRGFRTVFAGPAHPGAARFWPVAGQGLGYGDAFTILIADVLAAVAAGTGTDPSFRDGVKAAEFVDAALRSSERGEWVATRRSGSSP
jgi:predicted dehydrogenase